MNHRHAARHVVTLVLGLTSELAVITTEAAPALTDFPVVTRAPTGSASGDLSLAPCRFRIEADGRNYDAECGTLVVPENRRKEGGRLISLPVVRIPALGADPAEPVFWFQGGPGGSNLMSYPTDGILQRHDFVMVGYRGIDSDVKLDCPEVGESITRAESPALGPGARAAYRSGAAACAARLVRTGVDLAGYSMVETVDDVEAARKALGYGRIDLLGNSYGTRLQQIYMWRHPQTVHRAVLVAVNPPGHFIWDPRVVDEQLERYGELCALDDYCRSRTPDLADTLRQVSQNMPRSWLGIPVDPDTVKLLTFFSLMETVPGGIRKQDDVNDGDTLFPLYGPAAIDMWLDAAEGDASGMAVVSLAGRLFLPKAKEPAGWGHFLAMGSSTLDYYDPRRDYEDELMPADSILGAPASMLNWSFTQGWPANPARLEYNEVSSSDVETLLVSGTLDFSTPRQFARDELLPRLAHGHQVTLGEFGHTETFWYSQDAARAKLLNRFLDEGVVDETGYVYQPVVFAVERGWDTIARQLLAIVVALLLVIGASGWLLVRLLLRRSRRRKLQGELAARPVP